jgi:sterol desaturase/sphingolipid hydroxylase (fatty acid hydroxylase superfamily)
MMWQLTDNILGHTGYEIYPRWLMKTPLKFFLNTPTHHTMHHEKMRGNYGIYFNFWDRLMGTNHPHYEARFLEVTTRERKSVKTTPQLLTENRKAYPP